MQSETQEVWQGFDTRDILLLALRVMWPESRWLLGADSGPLWRATKKKGGGGAGAQSCNCKELKVANDLITLEAGSLPRSPQINPAQPTPWFQPQDPDQRTRSHHACRLWANKWVLFKTTKFIVICHMAMENRNRGLNTCIKARVLTCD